MSYQDWRQQWRLLKAIELLCEERQVSDVAHCLEFSPDSAFIAFFKKANRTDTTKFYETSNLTINLA
ncbi:hypothetical protein AK965_00810 [Vibrio sp. PID17_43]|nr:hypothetical protein AK965_00810 [Vibrio sp. PID17_43]